MTRQARQELLPLDGIGVRLGGAATSRPPAPREPLWTWRRAPMREVKVMQIFEGTAGRCTAH
jgi:hypothetical protein